MLKIRVKTKDFLRAIRIVDNAIEDDKTNSQNSGIYIQSNGDKLEFKGIGFNLFIKCECPANIIEEGQVIIKYKLIEEFLKKIDEEEVRIEENGKNIEVFSSGSSALYNMIKYEAPMELNMLNGSEYVLDKKDFTSGIENTIFAACTEPTKLTINAIKLDLENDVMKMIATDSFRLIYREIPVKENKSQENMSLSIPLKTSQSLLKIFKETNIDDVLVSTDGSKILFRLDDIEVISKVVELQFPEYKNILKNVTTNKNVKISSEHFKKKLEIVNLFVKDKKERKDVAEFFFTANELVMSGSNDTAKVEQRVSISRDTNEDLKIYLNTKYILEFLSTIKKDEILEIKMSTNVSAVLIKEDNEKSNDIYLTMPLNI